MDYNQFIELGLQSEYQLKMILCGSIDNSQQEKTGVVSVVYVSKKIEQIKVVLKQLQSENPDNYYMVYGVAEDQLLTSNNHYPSIGITKEDLT